MPLKERISAFDGLDITPEQREILEAIREFVDREIIPVAKELEAKDEFPTKIVEGLRDMGAFGMRIPTEYGRRDPLLLLDDRARRWLRRAVDHHHGRARRR